MTIIKITADRPIETGKSQDAIQGQYSASSQLSEHFSAQNAATLETSTYWVKSPEDSEPYVYCEFEQLQSVSRIEIQLMIPEKGFGKTLDFTIHY